MADGTPRMVELEDGVSLNVVEVGSGHPLILLHGGPGLDHHELQRHGRWRHAWHRAQPPRGGAHHDEQKQVEERYERNA